MRESNITGDLTLIVCPSDRRKSPFESISGRRTNEFGNSFSIISLEVVIILKIPFKGIL